MNVYGKKVKRPTVIFDNDCYTMHKIGEYEEIKEHYNAMRRALGSVDRNKLNVKLDEMGLPSLIKPLERTLMLLELPRNQELIDNVMNNAGYLKYYLGQLESNVVRINFESTD